MNINRISADIRTAETLCSSIGNPTNDEYIYDLAAYHTQQAVEKCLKYYLHNIYGEDDTTRAFKTHNISTLILMLNKYGYQASNELISMSDELTGWEASSRYGESLISTRDSILKGIHLAKKLYQDIEIFKNQNVITLANETVEEENEQTEEGKERE